MYVAELWRYPVKSMRGELLQEAEVLATGIRGDREIVVVSKSRQRVITSRTHHRLLGLQGGISPETDGATINGIPWNTPEALALVEEAVGEAVRLVHVTGTERFDILPLLVATDGAVVLWAWTAVDFAPTSLSVESKDLRTAVGRVEN